MSSPSRFQALGDRSTFDNQHVGSTTKPVFIRQDIFLLVDRQKYLPLTINVEQVYYRLKSSFFSLSAIYNLQYRVEPIGFWKL